MDTIVAASPNVKLLSALNGQGKRGPRRVVPVGTLEDLEAALSQARPAVVVVDASLDRDRTWEFVKRVKVEGKNGECRTPVIQLDSETELPFMILPDARMAPPHDPAVVSALCDEIIERRATARRLFVQECALELSTTPESIEKAGDCFDALVAAAGYDDHDQVALATTFREALGNAAEHGNKHDPRRKIRILYLRDVEKIGFVISDEGPGFDHTKFLARAEEVSALEHTRSRRATEARPGGLGVFIMKKTCDAIEFNDTGNSIYLMKYLPGHAKNAPASA